MKIGFDARWVSTELSGIGTYTMELLRQFVAIPGNDEFILFHQNDAVMEQLSSYAGISADPRFSRHKTVFGVFSPMNQLRLPAILRELGVSVFHSPNFMIPLTAFPRRRTGATRCVVSIHDLIPLLFPEYTPRAKKTRFFPLYKILMREITRRADLVITGSTCSRRDILAALPLKGGQPERVKVIPDGVSERFRPAAGQAADFQRGNNPGVRTILCVGRADPYKNIKGLIEAFALMRRSCSWQTRLKIAGPKDARYPEAERAAQALGVREQVEWTGYLPDDRLVREYRQADLFVMPSLYEGFGLPVLEAMACGTPVVCSNRGALPETAGDAALMVQPNDTIGLSEAMRRVLSDRRLARDMIGRGLKNAAKFSWKRTAELTLAAYRSLS